MSGTQNDQGVPKEEEEILNYFLDVRAFLSKMKQDRKQYLNSKDVMATYQKVLTRVRELDNIRKASHTSGPTAATTQTLIHSAELHNRVDSVIDDVFQLLSLSFLTVGLKNSAPATYASLSTVKSLLEHLNESSVYTHHDLRPIKERLDEVADIVEKNRYSTFASGMEDEDPMFDELRENKIEEDLLLRAKLQHCLQEYLLAEAKLEAIPEDLQPYMEKLFQIRRKLLSLAASTKSNSVEQGGMVSTQMTGIRTQDKLDEELSILKQSLAEVESHRNEEGKFVSSINMDYIPVKSQSVLHGLLDDCHDLIRDLSHQASGGFDLDSQLQPIYEEIVEIKTTLENLLVTRRWTLRETDLFTYQKRLAELDSLRVNGKFPSDSNDSRGQAILLYLLRRCYAIIYKLLESSEPVSEALQRIHNQLSTVRRCLLELKRMGGVDHERELYPYQMKLASLDNLRVDGKFYDAEGNIPEGQGILNALLAECFDILHEMKIEVEVREETNEDFTDEEHPAGATANKNIQMTKAVSIEEHSEPRQSARYLGVYDQRQDSSYQLGDDDDDDDAGDAIADGFVHYSDRSYEDEDTANLDA